MRLVPLASAALLLAPLVHAQAPAPEKHYSSPNLSFLGYTTNFASSIAGVDDGGDGLGDLLVGARQDPYNEGFGRAYLIDATSGALRRQFDSPTADLQGHFGHAVAALVDIDGDGRGDIAIGAPDEQQGLAGSGHVHVYSQASAVLGGGPLRTLVSPNAQIVGHFGFSLAALGDVDGNGRGDLAVGAPEETVGGAAKAGRVYVFDAWSGTLVHTLTSPSPLPNRRFGRVIARLPDVDGDGIDDLAANEPVDGLTFANVHVFSGASGAYLRSLACPPCGAGFGFALAGLEDIDGDGTGEVLVWSGNDTAGSVVVFDGATGAILHELTSPHPVPEGAFGASIADAGDQDGDGVHDILVGAPGEPGPHGPQSGRGYAFRGADFSLLSEIVQPDLPALQTHERIGTTATLLPDANGDGKPEYVLATPHSAIGGYGGGAIYAFFAATEVLGSATVRAGTPPNPIALVTTGTPVIGAWWWASIDHAAFAPGALADVFLLGFAPAELPTPVGTLLIDVAAPFVTKIAGPGQPFILVLPPVVGLVGLEAHLQGASVTASGALAATNALDIVLGSH